MLKMNGDYSSYSYSYSSVSSGGGHLISDEPRDDQNRTKYTQNRTKGHLISDEPRDSKRECARNSEPKKITMEACLSDYRNNCVDRQDQWEQVVTQMKSMLLSYMSRTQLDTSEEDHQSKIHRLMGERVSIEREAREKDHHLISALEVAVRQELPEAINLANDMLAKSQHTRERINPACRNPHNGDMVSIDMSQHQSQHAKRLSQAKERFALSQASSKPDFNAAPLTSSYRLTPTSPPLPLSHPVTPPMRSSVSIAVSQVVEQNHRSSIDHLKLMTKIEQNTPKIEQNTPKIEQNRSSIDHLKLLRDQLSEKEKGRPSNNCKKHAIFSAERGAALQLARDGVRHPNPVSLASGVLAASLHR